MHRISEREAVDELYEYTVQAEVRNPEFLQSANDTAQVDLKWIIGTPATVTIQIPGIGTHRPDAPGNAGRVNVGADRRYINGEIASAKI